MTAISPLDGRYADKIEDLQEYFCEAALIKKRLWVEVVWLEKLTEWLGVEKLSQKEKQRLFDWAKQLKPENLVRVKEIEEEINHDVKAVEYFIREKLKGLKLEKLSAWIHWGLTSEDVNNLAYGILLQEFKDKVLVKQETEVIKKLIKMAERDKGVVMPGRTHGQIAVPTTVGKELVVFASRADWWLKKLKDLKLSGKLNGAVGNFNAQVKLYPQKDWLDFSCKLVAGLGLEPVMVTTQIEPGDRLAFGLDLVRGLNNVWLNLARDCWLYIALDYFKQKVVAKEVGSSTMPHKVNPIDFENAEGNLELANSWLTMMSNKFPVSRLQRDLSDSTVKRNLGVGMGQTVLAIKSLVKGLDKIEPNREFLQQEIKNHPEMMAEVWQLEMKIKGDDQAYEKVKKMTRGKGGIRPLKSVKDSDVSRAFALEKYIGLAEKITDQAIRGLR